MPSVARQLALPLFLCLFLGGCGGSAKPTIPVDSPLRPFTPPEVAETVPAPATSPSSAAPAAAPAPAPAAGKETGKAPGKP